MSESREQRFETTCAKCDRRGTNRTMHPLTTAITTHWICNDHDACLADQHRAKEGES